jgi:hypothetical protein
MLDRLCVVYDRTNSPSIWTEVDYFRAIGAVLEANYPETLKRAFVVPTGGKETPPFAPFVYKMHDFTKTGSGQT